MFIRVYPWFSSWWFILFPGRRSSVLVGGFILRILLALLAFLAVQFRVRRRASGVTRYPLDILRLPRYILRQMTPNPPKGVIELIVRFERNLSACGYAQADRGEYLRSCSDGHSRIVAVIVSEELS